MVLLQVASAPHPEELNREALFLCKGDIFAGETKQAREPTSTMVSVYILFCLETVNIKTVPIVNKQVIASDPGSGEGGSYHLRW
jgi:hypothetical protein